MLNQQFQRQQESQKVPEAQAEKVDAVNKDQQQIAPQMGMNPSMVQVQQPKPSQPQPTINGMTMQEHALKQYYQSIGQKQQVPTQVDA